VTEYTVIQTLFSAVSFVGGALIVVGIYCNRNCINLIVGNSGPGYGKLLLSAVLSFFFGAVLSISGISCIIGYYLLYG
jgi:hypothetical protein